MKILIGCEESQTVTKEFRKAGHEAYSCDIIDCSGGHPEWHIKNDVLDELDKGWDLAIFHPPCTFLTNAGVRWLYSKKTGFNIKRRNDMRLAGKFFQILKKSNIPKIAIENPIPHKYAKDYIGDYDQLIQPWQFGHKETKAICLWLKNLPKLSPTNIVGPPKTVEEKKDFAVKHRLPPGPDRSKLRSKFFEGIAKAMVEQWT